MEIWSFTKTAEEEELLNTADELAGLSEELAIVLLEAKDDWFVDIAEEALDDTVDELGDSPTDNNKGVLDDKDTLED